MTTPDEPGRKPVTSPSGTSLGGSGSVRVLPADQPEPDPIPTGFPEPAAPDEPREPSPDGTVRLAPVNFGSLTVPPLEPGGESVVITAEGTDCDPETAGRAHEAARLAGFRLREV